MRDGVRSELKRHQIATPTALDNVVEMRDGVRSELKPYPFAAGTRTVPVCLNEGWGPFGIETITELTNPPEKEIESK